MAFDKAKVLRAAEKSLAQGKIPAAIREYQHIVDHDPEDHTALNMLGDLYARNGRKPEAISCFKQIAEHYRAQGFNLKAIAMFKKIDRLAPNDPTVADILGSLYEQQGLVVEARANYIVVAEDLERKGQPRKALEILQKVADLEPNNTDTRLKLAQGYKREGLLAEAADAFAEAGHNFLLNSKFDKALDAFNESLEAVKGHREALEGMLAAHIARGTSDEAAEVLEEALNREPEDVGILSMLATAYVESEDPARAKTVIEALVAIDDSQSTRFLDVVQLFLNEDHSEAAIGILSERADSIIASGEIERLLKLLNEILARHPEHLESLRLLVRVSQWQCDDDKTRVALERLAEAAENLGNAELERFAIAHLAQLVPDARYLDRLEALGGMPPEMKLAANRQSEESYSEAPTFESFAVNEFQETPGWEGASAVEDAQFVEIADPSETSAADPSASFADLNSGWEMAEGVFEDNSAHSIVTGQETEISDQNTVLLNQELESVDFYISQGYLDIARDTLDMLERQFGPANSIDERRTAVEKTEQAAADSVAPSEYESEFELSFSAEAAPVDEPAPDVNLFLVPEESAPAVAETEPVSTFAETTVEPKPQPRSHAGIDPGLAAIFDEFKEAIEEDETEQTDGDFETHYNLGLAYKEMDLLDEAVEEFQQAAALTAPEDGNPRYLQCCNMLGACFMEKKIHRLAIMWFQRGLMAPGHPEDAYQALRYDLATAYEMSGDVESAINTFTEVYGVNVSYRGVGEKLRDLQSVRAAS